MSYARVQQVGPAHVHTSTLHGIKNPKGRKTWVGLLKLLNITIWTPSPVGPSLMEIDGLDRWWRRSRVFYGEESSPPVPECPLRSQNRLCRLLLILVHGEKLSGSILKWWKLKCRQWQNTWGTLFKKTSPLHLSHVIKGYFTFGHDTYSLFSFGPFAKSFWLGRGEHVIYRNPKYFWEIEFCQSSCPP